MDEGNESILLNDDCLLAICQLSLNDLMRAVRVTKQFQRVTQEAFRIKYKKLKLHEHCTRPSKKWLKCIFSNFGHLMDDLTVSAIELPPMDGPLEKEITGLIEKYCNKGSKHLRALRLDHIKRDVHKIQSVLDDLHTLELEDVSLPFSIGYLLNKMQKAKNVKIMYCSAPRRDIFRAQLIPNLQLEKLALKNREDLFMLDILENIDTMYPNLIYLKYETVGGELFKPFGKNIHKIANLRNLLSLDVSIRFHDPAILIRRMIENESRLKVLKLHQIETTKETIDDICKIKLLEELHIFQIIGGTSYDLLCLARELKNLRVLSTYMNHTRIKDVIKIVSQAKKLTFGEFSLSEDDQWDWHSFNQVEAIIKNQRREKITIIIHRQWYTHDPTIENVILIKSKSNPYVELKINVFPIIGIRN